ncbi:MAG: heme exporter protein CcmD [Rubrivivax sp.]|nr:MAG: heme exporter protein CcmD [Rubrivivax sp.]
MNDHGFYLTLAYGVSALLIVAEVLLLWRRCARAWGRR